MSEYASFIDTAANTTQGAVSAWAENGRIYYAFWNEEADTWSDAKPIPGATGGRNVTVTIGNVLKDTDTARELPAVVISWESGIDNQSSLYGVIGLYANNGDLIFSKQRNLIPEPVTVAAHKIGISSGGDLLIGVVQQTITDPVKSTDTGISDDDYHDSDINIYKARITRASNSEILNQQKFTGDSYRGTLSELFKDNVQNQEILRAWINGQEITLDRDNYLSGVGSINLSADGKLVFERGNNKPSIITVTASLLIENNSTHTTVSHSIQLLPTELAEAPASSDQHSVVSLSVSPLNSFGNEVSTNKIFLEFPKIDESKYVRATMFAPLKNHTPNQFRSFSSAGLYSTQSIASSNIANNRLNSEATQASDESTDQFSWEHISETVTNQLWSNPYVLDPYYYLQHHTSLGRILGALGNTASGPFAGFGRSLSQSAASLPKAFAKLNPLDLNFKTTLNYRRQAGADQTNITTLSTLKLFLESNSVNIQESIQKQQQENQYLRRESFGQEAERLGVNRLTIEKAIRQKDYIEDLITRSSRRNLDPYLEKTYGRLITLHERSYENIPEKVREWAETEGQRFRDLFPTIQPGEIETAAKEYVELARAVNTRLAELYDRQNLRIENEKRDLEAKLNLEDSVIKINGVIEEWRASTYEINSLRLLAVDLEEFQKILETTITNLSLEDLKKSYQAILEEDTDKLNTLGTGKLSVEYTKQLDQLNEQLDQVLFNESIWNNILNDIGSNIGSRGEILTAQYIGGAVNILDQYGKRGLAEYLSEQLLNLDGIVIRIDPKSPLYKSYITDFESLLEKHSGSHFTQYMDTILEEAGSLWTGKWTYKGRLDELKGRREAIKKLEARYQEQYDSGEITNPSLLAEIKTNLTELAELQTIAEMRSDAIIYVALQQKNLSPSSELFYEKLGDFVQTIETYKHYKPLLGKIDEIQKRIDESSSLPDYNSQQDQIRLAALQAIQDSITQDFGIVTIEDYTKQIKAQKLRLDIETRLEEETSNYLRAQQEGNNSELVIIENRLDTLRTLLKEFDAGYSIESLREPQNPTESQAISKQIEGVKEVINLDQDYKNPEFLESLKVSVPDNLEQLTTEQYTLLLENAIDRKQLHIESIQEELSIARKLKDRITQWPEFVDKRLEHIDSEIRKYNTLGLGVGKELAYVIEQNEDRLLSLQEEREYYVNIKLSEYSTSSDEFSAYLVNVVDPDRYAIKELSDKLTYEFRDISTVITEKETELQKVTDLRKSIEEHLYSLTRVLDTLTTKINSGKEKLNILNSFEENSIARTQAQIQEYVNLIDTLRSKLNDLGKTELIETEFNSWQELVNSYLKEQDLFQEVINKRNNVIDIEEEARNTSEQLTSIDKNLINFDASDLGDQGSNDVSIDKDKTIDDGFDKAVVIRSRIEHLISTPTQNQDYSSENSQTQATNSMLYNRGISYEQLSDASNSIPEQSDSQLMLRNPNYNSESSISDEISNVRRDNSIDQVSNLAENQAYQLYTNLNGLGGASNASQLVNNVERNYYEPKYDELGQNFTLGEYQGKILNSPLAYASNAPEVVPAKSSIWSESVSLVIGDPTREKVESYLKNTPKDLGGSTEAGSNFGGGFTGGFLFEIPFLSAAGMYASGTKYYHYSPLATTADNHIYLDRHITEIGLQAIFSAGAYLDLGLVAPGAPGNSLLNVSAELSLDSSQGIFLDYKYTDGMMIEEEDESNISIMPLNFRVNSKNLDSSSGEVTYYRNLPPEYQTVFRYLFGFGQLGNAIGGVSTNLVTGRLANKIGKYLNLNNTQAVSRVISQGSELAVLVGNFPIIVSAGANLAFPAWQYNESLLPSEFGVTSTVNAAARFTTSLLFGAANAYGKVSYGLKYEVPYNNIAATSVSAPYNIELGYYVGTVAKILYSKQGQMRLINADDAYATNLNLFSSDKINTSIRQAYLSYFEGEPLLNNNSLLVGIAGTTPILSGALASQSDLRLTDALSTAINAENSAHESSLFMSSDGVFLLPHLSSSLSEDQNFDILDDHGNLKNLRIALRSTSDSISLFIDGRALQGADNDSVFSEHLVALRDGLVNIKLYQNQDDPNVWISDNLAALYKLKPGHILPFQIDQSLAAAENYTKPPSFDFRYSYSDNQYSFNQYLSPELGMLASAHFEAPTSRLHEGSDYRLGGSSASSAGAATASSEPYPTAILVVNGGNAITGTSEDFILTAPGPENALATIRGRLVNSDKSVDGSVDAVDLYRTAASSAWKDGNLLKLTLDNLKVRTSLGTDAILSLTTNDNGLITDVTVAKGKAGSGYLQGDSGEFTAAINYNDDNQTIEADTYALVRVTVTDGAVSDVALIPQSQVGTFASSRSPDSDSLEIAVPNRLGGVGSELDLQIITRDTLELDRVDQSDLNLGGQQSQFIDGSFRSDAIISFTQGGVDPEQSIRDLYFTENLGLNLPLKVHNFVDGSGWQNLSFRRSGSNYTPGLDGYNSDSSTANIFFKDQKRTSVVLFSNARTDFIESDRDLYLLENALKDSQIYVSYRLSDENQNWYLSEPTAISDPLSKGTNSSGLLQPFFGIRDAGVQPFFGENNQILAAWIHSPGDGDSAEVHVRTAIAEDGKASAGLTWGDIQKIHVTGGFNGENVTADAITNLSLTYVDNHPVLSWSLRTLMPFQAVVLQGDYDTYYRLDELPSNGTIHNDKETALIADGYINRGQQLYSTSNSWLGKLRTSSIQSVTGALDPSTLDSRIVAGDPNPGLKFAGGEYITLPNRILDVALDPGREDPSGYSAILYLRTDRPELTDQDDATLQSIIDTGLYNSDAELPTDLTLPLKLKRIESTQLKPKVGEDGNVVLDELSQPVYEKINGYTYTSFIPASSAANISSDFQQGSGLSPFNLSFTIPTSVYDFAQNANTIEHSPFSVTIPATLLDNLVEYSVSPISAGLNSLRTADYDLELSSFFVEDSASPGDPALNDDPSDNKNVANEFVYDDIARLRINAQQIPGWSLRRRIEEDGEEFIDFTWGIDELGNPQILSSPIAADQWMQIAVSYGPDKSMDPVYSTSQYVDSSLDQLPNAFPSVARLWINGKIVAEAIDDFASPKAFPTFAEDHQLGYGLQGSIDELILNDHPLEQGSSQLEDLETSRYINPASATEATFSSTGFYNTTTGEWNWLNPEHFKKSDYIFTSIPSEVTSGPMDAVASGENLTMRPDGQSDFVATIRLTDIPPGSIIRGLRVKLDSGEVFSVGLGREFGWDAQSNSAIPIAQGNQGSILAVLADDKLLNSGAEKADLNHIFLSNEITLQILLPATMPPGANSATADLVDFYISSPTQQAQGSDVVGIRSLVDSSHVVVFTDSSKHSSGSSLSSYYRDTTISKSIQRSLPVSLQEIGAGIQFDLANPVEPALISNSSQSTSDVSESFAQVYAESLALGFFANLSDSQFKSLNLLAVGNPSLNGIAGAGDKRGVVWILPISDPNDASNTSLINERLRALNDFFSAPGSALSQAGIPGLVIEGRDLQSIGTSITFGDLNGDDFPELVIGASQAGANQAGELIIIDGIFLADRLLNNEWKISLDDLAYPDSALSKASRYIQGAEKSELGASLAYGAFGVNGANALAIGAPGFMVKLDNATDKKTSKAESVGAVYIINNTAELFTSTDTMLDTQNPYITGDLHISNANYGDNYSTHRRFGSALSITSKGGDFSGDQIADLVIGIPGLADQYQTRAGFNPKVVGKHGPIGDYANTLTSVINSAAVLLPTGVNWKGSFEGDKDEYDYDDAKQYITGGVLVIEGGQIDNTKAKKVLIYGDTYFGDNSAAGTTIATGSSLIGNGIDDLAVALPGVDWTNGQVAVIEGSLIRSALTKASTTDPSILSAGLDASLTITGGSGTQQYGSSLTLNGDVNGDGHADLVIGDPFFNDKSGRINVVFGVTDLTTVAATSQSLLSTGETYSQIDEAGLPSYYMNLSIPDNERHLTFYPAANGQQLGKTIASSNISDPQTDLIHDLIIPTSAFGSTINIVYGKPNLNQLGGFSLHDLAAGDGIELIKPKLPIDRTGNFGFVGDINGDGLSDAVYTYDASLGFGISYGGNGRSVHNVSDAGTGGTDQINLDNQISIQLGHSDSVIQSVFSVGDINYDGVYDLLVNTVNNPPNPGQEIHRASHILLGGDLLTNNALSQYVAPEAITPRQAFVTKLSRGELLLPGQAMRSEDGRFFATMQSDGDLVIRTSTNLTDTATIFSLKDLRDPDGSKYLFKHGKNSIQLGEIDQTSLIATEDGIALTNSRFTSDSTAFDILLEPGSTFMEVAGSSSTIEAISRPISNPATNTLSYLQLNNAGQFEAIDVDGAVLYTVGLAHQSTYQLSLEELNQLAGSDKVDRNVWDGSIEQGIAAGLFTIASDSAGLLTMAGRTKDNKITWRQTNQDNTWNDWQVIPGWTSKVNPSIISHQNKLFLAHRGDDGYLYISKLTNGTWGQAFQIRPYYNIGMSLSEHAPILVSGNSDHPDVIFVDHESILSIVQGNEYQLADGIVKAYRFHDVHNNWIKVQPDTTLAAASQGDSVTLAIRSPRDESTAQLSIYQKETGSLIDSFKLTNLNDFTNGVLFDSTFTIPFLSADNNTLALSSIVNNSIQTHGLYSKAPSSRITPLTDRNILTFDYGFLAGLKNVDTNGVAIYNSVDQTTKRTINWSDWDNSLESATAAGLITSLTTSTGKLIVVALRDNPDNSQGNQLLWRQSSDNGLTWDNNWQSIYDATSHNQPSLVEHGETVFVAFRGHDGKIYLNTLKDNKWTTNFAIRDGNETSRNVSGPVLVSDAYSLHIYFPSADGDSDTASRIITSSSSSPTKSESWSTGQELKDRSGDVLRSNSQLSAGNIGTSHYLTIAGQTNQYNQTPITTWISNSKPTDQWTKLKPISVDNALLSRSAAVYADSSLDSLAIGYIGDDSTFKSFELYNDNRYLPIALTHAATPQSQSSLIPLIGTLASGAVNTSGKHLALTSHGNIVSIEANPSNLDLDVTAILKEWLYQRQKDDPTLDDNIRIATQLYADSLSQQLISSSDSTSHNLLLVTQYLDRLNPGLGIEFRNFVSARAPIFYTEPVILYDPNTQSLIDPSKYTSIILDSDGNGRQELLLTPKRTTDNTIQNLSFDLDSLGNGNYLQATSHDSILGSLHIVKASWRNPGLQLSQNAKHIESNGKSYATQPLWALGGFEFDTEQRPTSNHTEAWISLPLHSSSILQSLLENRSFELKVPVGVFFPRYQDGDYGADQTWLHLGSSSFPSFKKDGHNLDGLAIKIDERNNDFEIYWNGTGVISSKNLLNRDTKDSTNGVDPGHSKTFSDLMSYGLYIRYQPNSQGNGGSLLVNVGSASIYATENDRSLINKGFSDEFIVEDNILIKSPSDFGIHAFGWSGDAPGFHALGAIQINDDIPTAYSSEADQQKLHSVGDLNGDGYDDYVGIGYLNSGYNWEYGLDSNGSFIYRDLATYNTSEDFTLAKFYDKSSSAYQDPPFDTDYSPRSDQLGYHERSLVAPYIVWGQAASSDHSQSISPIIRGSNKTFQEYQKESNHGSLAGYANFTDPANLLISGGSDYNADGFDDLVVTDIALGDGGTSYILYGAQGLAETYSYNNWFGTFFGAAGTLSEAGEQVGFDILNLKGESGGFPLPGFTDPTTLGFKGDSYKANFKGINLEKAPEGVYVSSFTGIPGYTISGISSTGHSTDYNADGIADLYADTILTPGSTVNSESSYILFGNHDFTLPGSTRIVGTPDSDSLKGTVVNDIVLGFSGDDIIQGMGGLDVLNGGPGNDLIYVNGDHFRQVDGGPGYDTIALRGELDQPWDFTTLAYRLRNIESISLFDYGANEITLNAAAIAAITSSDGQISVDGDQHSFSPRESLLYSLRAWYPQNPASEFEATIATAIESVLANTIDSDPFDLVVLDSLIDDLQYQYLDEAIFRYYQPSLSDPRDALYDIILTINTELAEDFYAFTQHHVFLSPYKALDLFGLWVSSSLQQPSNTLITESTILSQLVNVPTSFVRSYPDYFVDSASQSISHEGLLSSIYSRASEFVRASEELSARTNGDSILSWLSTSLDLVDPEILSPSDPLKRDAIYDYIVDPISLLEQIRNQFHDDLTSVYDTLTLSSEFAFAGRQQQNDGHNIFFYSAPTGQSVSVTENILVNIESLVSPDLRPIDPTKPYPDSSASIQASTASSTLLQSGLGTIDNSSSTSLESTEVVNSSIGEDVYVTLASDIVKRNDDYELDLTLTRSGYIGGTSRVTVKTVGEVHDIVPSYHAEVIFLPGETNRSIHLPLTPQSAAELQTASHTSQNLLEIIQLDVALLPDEPRGLSQTSSHALVVYNGVATFIHDESNLIQLDVAELATLGNFAFLSLDPLEVSAQHLDFDRNDSPDAPVIFSLLSPDGISATDALIRDSSGDWSLLSTAALKHPDSLTLVSPEELPQDLATRADHVLSFRVLDGGLFDSDEINGTTSVVVVPVITAESAINATSMPLMLIPGSTTGDMLHLSLYESDTIGTSRVIIRANNTSQPLDQLVRDLSSDQILLESGNSLITANPGDLIGIIYLHGISTHDFLALDGEERLSGLDPDNTWKITTPDFLSPGGIFSRLDGSINATILPADGELEPFSRLPALLGTPTSDEWIRPDAAIGLNFNHQLQISGAGDDIVGRFPLKNYSLDLLAGSNNIVFTGSGADTFSPSRSDLGFTGSGDDSVSAYSPFSRIATADGDDSIYVYAPGQLVLAGAGNDSITNSVTYSSASIYLEDQNLIVQTGTGSDTVFLNSPEQLYPRVPLLLTDFDIDLDRFGLFDLSFNDLNFSSINSGSGTVSYITTESDKQGTVTLAIVNNLADDELSNSYLYSTTYSPSVSLELNSTGATGNPYAVGPVDSSDLHTDHLISGGQNGLLAFAKANFVRSSNSADLPPLVSVYIHDQSGAVNVAAANSQADSKTILSREFSEPQRSFIEATLDNLSRVLDVTVDYTDDVSRSNLDIYLDDDVSKNTGGQVYGVVLNNDNGSSKWSELILNASAFDDDDDLFRFTVTHELGHVFGLEHHFDATDGDSLGSSSSGITTKDTIMSYSKPTDSEYWSTTYSSKDWLALVNSWGFSRETNEWIFSYIDASLYHPESTVTVGSEEALSLLASSDVLSFSGPAKTTIDSTSTDSTDKVSSDHVDSSSTSSSDSDKNQHSGLSFVDDISENSSLSDRIESVEINKAQVVVSDSTSLETVLPSLPLSHQSIPFASHWRGLDLASSTVQLLDHSYQFLPVTSADGSESDVLNDLSGYEVIANGSDNYLFASSRNTIYAEAGDDTIISTAGRNNTLYGGHGHDLLVSSSHGDQLFAGIKDANAEYYGSIVDGVSNRFVIDLDSSANPANLDISIADFQIGIDSLFLLNDDPQASELVLTSDNYATIQGMLLRDHNVDLNAAPILSPLATHPIFIIPGVTTTLFVDDFARDLDGDRLRFAIDNAPTWIQLGDDNQTINISFPDSPSPHLSLDDFQVSVSDEHATLILPLSFVDPTHTATYPPLYTGQTTTPTYLTSSGSTAESFDSDSDGLLEVTYAPDGKWIDGNSDGIPDVQQANVAGFRFINDGSSSSDFGALEVADGVKLQFNTDPLILPSADGAFSFSGKDGVAVSAGLPQGVTNRFAGVIGFEVTNVAPGGTTDVTLSLPPAIALTDPSQSAYLRYNYLNSRFEEFVDAAGSPLYTFVDRNADGVLDGIQLTLVDGDLEWDGDGRVNGRVKDPGTLVDAQRSLIGNNKANRLIGNVLANIIDGRGGRDTLIGHLGNDILKGRSGNDRFDGGEGADLIIGGGGADRFIYRSLADSTVAQSDTIRKVSGKDRFNLRHFDTDVKFTFIDGDKFSGIAGELRATRTKVQADLNGDGNADLFIRIQSESRLTTDNFIL